MGCAHTLRSTRITPLHRPAQTVGRIASVTCLGGLHRHYVRIIGRHRVSAAGGGALYRRAQPRILGARMRRLALLTLILVVVACRASAAEHKLFAWRVAGDPANDPGTVYLLGSIHVGKPDLYPLPQPIELAFAGSAELVEEVDLSGANLALLKQQILQRGLYIGGDKLENHLS